MISWYLESDLTPLTIHNQCSTNNLGIHQLQRFIVLDFQTGSDGNWARNTAVKCEYANRFFTSSTSTLTQILILGLLIVFLSCRYLYLYWVFVGNLLQHTLYQCRRFIDPLKKEETWETLQRAVNIRNHDFRNLLFAEGHQLPTIFYYRWCYQHFTMKSSLERISTANTKRLELLETKLRTIDLFDTYESNWRPNRDLVRKQKNAILKNECIFCKKNKYKKKV